MAYGKRTGSRATTITLPQKKIPRSREIIVSMPEDVVTLLEAIKKPNMPLSVVIAEIVYKEVRAYVAAQKLIEEESKDPSKIPEPKLAKKEGSPVISVPKIVDSKGRQIV